MLFRGGAELPNSTSPLVQREQTLAVAWEEVEKPPLSLFDPPEGGRAYPVSPRGEFGPSARLASAIVSSSVSVLRTPAIPAWTCGARKNVGARKFP